MRIRLACHAICSGPLRGGAAREACHCEIEAAPEKMNWPAFPDKPGPELFQDAMDAQQHLPEPLGGFGIVGPMHAVLIEGNGIGYFNGHAPNLYVYPTR